MPLRFADSRERLVFHVYEHFPQLSCSRFLARLAFVTSVNRDFMPGNARPSTPVALAQVTRKPIARRPNSSLFVKLERRVSLSPVVCTDLGNGCFFGNHPVPDRFIGISLGKTDEGTNLAATDHESARVKADLARARGDAAKGRAALVGV